MKLSFTVLAAFFSLVIAAPGQYAIIKQRAKELVNQNNVRQGVTPPTQSPAPSAPGAAAAPSLSAGATALQTDLANLTAGTPATTAQKQKLTRDVMAMTASKMSSEVAAKFVDDVVSACALSPLSSASRVRLARDVEAILNPSKYPLAKPDGIYADIQAIFQDAGVKRNSAVAVADDVKAISVDLQKPH